MEYLDICDENGIPTGKTVSREQAHREGILHRTAHVWIARKTPGGHEVLLQKRSLDKESYPGLWDTSSAGHIPAGEEPLPSALREMKEELGIAAAPEDLHFAGTFRTQYEKEFHGRLFKDNEFTFVYVYGREVDEKRLTLQKEEVDAAAWFDCEAVYEEIRYDRSRFCMPRRGLELVRQYLTAED